MSIWWILLILALGAFACFVVRKTPDTALTAQNKVWAQWIVWVVILVYFLYCFFGPPDGAFRIQRVR